MNEPVIDLNPLYHTALEGIHRAYVFMRFGTQGVRVGDFEDTQLPGRHRVLIVPEPMPQELLIEYITQFRAWVVGNGLRELIEAFSQFLDEVYSRALRVLIVEEQSNRQKTFEGAALRTKVQRLREEMSIEGSYAKHFESFASARNALTHGVGKVRLRDCTVKDELVIKWRGVDVYFTAENGSKYRIGDEPFGVDLFGPLETVFIDREKHWQLGQRVELSTEELTEICYMANHEAIDILQSLQEFGLRHNVTMKAANLVRGG